MSTYKYSQKDIHRLADLLAHADATRSYVGEHRETIDKLFGIIEELLSIPGVYSKTLVSHATDNFINKINSSISTKTENVKEKHTFPINIMYLHTNKNLIPKTIYSEADMDEIEDSTFIGSYWMLKSIGDAIRCLLQASDLQASPRDLLEKYRAWQLEDVINTLEDKDFVAHIFKKRDEWIAKMNEEDTWLNLSKLF